MTEKTIDEHKAELAQLLEDASKQTATPEGAQGAFGMPNLWGMVASHLFDAIEQIIQTAIQQRLDKQK
ncbi:MAG TPA: hypothetical protein VK602_15050 [Phyllobacterium sp.]|nr:hypothetical protein [Phyllobacterium sp.]